MKEAVMPRLFTAFDVPSEIAQSLILLRGGLLSARWIEPSDFHVTLRFIGDVSPSQMRDIDRELRYISRSPFTLTLDELMSFGGDRPRAIVARVQPHPLLMEMQAEQERIMRRLGLPPEVRKYTPHITLARLKGTSAQDVAFYLAQCGLFVKRSFDVSRVLLMSSRHSVGGGPYVIEAEYPFHS